MVEIEAGTMIDRPVEEVWKFMTDFTNFPKWNPRILEMRQTSAGPQGVGTTIHSTHPRGRALDEQVIEYEPNRRFVLEAASGPLKGTRVTFRVATFEGKTRLTRTINLKLGGFYRLLEPIAVRNTKREMRTIDNVKLILESGAEV